MPKVGSFQPLAIAPLGELRPGRRLRSLWRPGQLLGGDASASGANRATALRLVLTGDAETT